MVAVASELPSRLAAERNSGRGNDGVLGCRIASREAAGEERWQRRSVRRRAAPRGSLSR